MSTLSIASATRRAYGSHPTRCGSPLGVAGLAQRWRISLIPAYAAPIRFARPAVYPFRIKARP